MTNPIRFRDETIERLERALVQAMMQFQEIADYAESEYPNDATVAVIARAGEQMADMALKQKAAAGSTPEGEEAT